MKNLFFKAAEFILFTALIIITLQCARIASPTLPVDMFGIKIGMTKDAAEARLRQIGKFIREENQGEQVWLLNDNPQFEYLAVGYDRDRQIQYVTAIANPNKSQSFFYKDVGDLSTAKQERAGPNRRYTWEIAADGDNPAHWVIAQGDNADSLSLLTLTRPIESQEKDEDEKDE